MGLFKKLFRTENILYYPGCLIKFVGTDLEDNYKKILSLAGVDFIQLHDLELCCGSPVLNSGHRKEAEEIAEKNLKAFREHGITKIITSCPACYKTFANDYPNLVKNWGIEVEHITKTINRAIKKGKLTPNEISSDVTYHDPCHLGRHCGIYEEPREIIRASGAKLKEMRLSREYAVCCGAGSGVKSNYPLLANAIAKERAEMAKETKAKFIITTCPMCYYNLRENASGIEVMELSELFIKKEAKK
jgi:heterodisulfide reductase subunit D